MCRDGFDHDLRGRADGDFGVAGEEIRRDVLVGVPLGVSRRNAHDIEEIGAADEMTVDAKADGAEAKQHDAESGGGGG